MTAAREIFVQSLIFFLFKFAILFFARGSKCFVSSCSSFQFCSLQGEANVLCPFAQVCNFVLCKVVILLWEKEGGHPHCSYDAKWLP